MKNVVMITVDQMRGDCLGFLGNEHPVMTPHLDQLAAEGVHFSRAGVTCPVCMPQRVSLLTGQSASRFGLTDNFHVRSPIDRSHSLPAVLTRNGYQTKAVGKMHFEPDRARMGFEHVALHPNDYVAWLEDQGYGGMYRGHGLGGNEVYPVRSAVPERYTHTHWIIDRSVDFLHERDPECPFFLWMVFEAPHSPFDPPEPFDTMYDRFDIPEPLHPEWAAENMPVMLKRKRAIANYENLNDQIIREARRKYYGQITHIDYQLGRFLGELKTMGMLDNTLIIFNSDHGEHLGDYGLFAKSTMLSESMHVPLIIRGPGVVASETVETPVINADLVPTILEYLNLEADAQMEFDGSSLLPVLQGETDQTLSQREIVGEIGTDVRAASISDGEWKYVYYEDHGEEQLFHIKTDPYDMEDLSGRAEYIEIKSALRMRLRERLNEYGSQLVQEDGKFKVSKEPLDLKALRSKNTMGMRGPMRYGQGYGGGW